MKNKGLILQERTFYWNRVMMGRWYNLPRLGFWSSNRALSFPCSSHTCSTFLTHTVSSPRSRLVLLTQASSPLWGLSPSCIWEASQHRLLVSFLEHDTGKSKHWSIKGERRHCGQPGKSAAHVPFPAKHNMLWWIIPFILNTCYSQPIIHSQPHVLAQKPCSCSESSSLHSCSVVRPE